MEKYRTYDDETLLKLQKTEISMMKDLIAFCDKHKIDYFGLAGTNLGAIRHQGFIPWDDDMDIGLMRKDYDKFMKLAPKELGDKYYFIDNRIDHNYYPSCGKMCKKNTTFVGYDAKNTGMELGIFIDLFPFDYVSNDEKERRKQAKKAWLYGKFAILSRVSNPVIFAKGIKGIILFIGCKVLYYVMKLFHQNPYKLYQKGDKLLYTKKTKYISFPYDTSAYMNLFKYCDIYPTKKVKFNNIKINVPNNSDAILKTVYGDYMSLPKEEDRHNHYPYKLDFKKGRNE